MNTKKNNEIGLNENEFACLKTINETLQLKGKSLHDIKSELEALIVEDEKDSIYKFEEIEGKVLKLLQELTSTEEKFRMFEASVTGYNEEFESFFRKSETIQRQNELIETRQANQLKLTETLKLLFSGIELTKEEKTILLTPSFETQENLEDIERVLEKIGKFLKYSKEKYQTFKGFKAQLDEVQAFLKQFLIKYKENLRLLMKKSLNKLTEEDLLENRLPETSELRRTLMTMRRILFSLLLINSEEKTFFQSMLKEIASVVSQFLMILQPKYEKLWLKELGNFPILKEKWHFNSNYYINNEDTVKKEEIGANQWFDDLFLHIRSQLESDESYFAKFFSYEGGNKLTTNSEETIIFMEESYKDFSRKFEDFLNNFLKIANFGVFLLESRIRQFLTNGNEENNANVVNNNAFSRGFFKKIAGVLIKKKEEVFKGFNDFLEGLDVDSRHCGVLGFVRNFIKITGGISWEMNLEGDLENVTLDMVKLLEIVVRILQKIAKKKEKYEDVVMFGNLYFIIKEAEGFNSALMKTIANKIRPLFTNHCDNYSRYLLSYNSTKFMEFWLNVKKLTASEINSESKFSKSNFNKILKSSFGNIHKSLDKIVKRLKKQLSKDQILVCKAFEIYSEFVMKEMKEIEKFYEIHYNDHPIIRRNEIELEFMEKKKMLM